MELINIIIHQQSTMLRFLHFFQSSWPSCTVQKPKKPPLNKSSSINRQNIISPSTALSYSKLNPRSNPKITSSPCNVSIATFTSHSLSPHSSKRHSNRFPQFRVQHLVHLTTDRTERVGLFHPVQYCITVLHYTRPVRYASCNNSSWIPEAWPGPPSPWGEYPSRYVSGRQPTPAN